ncbi:pilus assembly protein [Uliginosibacterium paludis]|uniref:PilC/PilY family type IV pilus protein n=1 Tax=Uliginosibacterium paludis TaxID=1615952 RepID=A0ABV2CK45_9RHOO
MIPSSTKKTLAPLGFLMALLLSSPVISAPSQKPLFLGTSAPPLMMLVMQRDHKLYYEAYNDASDLTGDGVPDIGYKPSKIDYLGYFDSNICYEYSATNKRFEPKSSATSKQCSKQWSGDFLNYLTTSRMDALRRVLYGGARYLDTKTETVLQRAFIPQDAHSWGKEYTSIAVNGYDITKYTPLALPASGKRHLFANTTLLNTADPLLRVRVDSTNRIWEWLSKERPVAGNDCASIANSNSGSACTGTLTDYAVRVQVCVSGLLDSVCTKYASGYYKPTGLLQKYGENESMHFGLLSGSYQKNLSGGVLRKNVGKFTDEIDAGTGQFLLQADNDQSIINTLNRLKVTGFGGSYEYSCGWITTQALTSGNCQMWGNPLAEMMFETVKYFAGGSVTSVYSVSQNSGEESTLKLPVASWKNPYAAAPAGGGAKTCAKPFILAISDIYPSYDSDELPGVDSNFKSSSYNDSFSTFNAKKVLDQIGNDEGISGSYFIGQSGNSTDGAPTAKSISGLGSIRGLAPEEPTKQGSYYSAAVAKWARMTDVNTVTGDQKVQTFAVAMASPLPTVRIPVSNGNFITVIPFAKSVAGSGISQSKTSFQPTNQLVDFYIDDIKNTDSSNADSSVNGGRPYYKFRINFEDVEQGADHDMDAIATYTVSKNADGTVTVSVSSDYAYGGMRQHMGYVISGTTADGTFLVVKDQDGGDGNGTIDYFLNYPAGKLSALTSSRTFTAGTTAASFIPHDPLWYAAKWGGYKDLNNSNSLDATNEWDSDGDGTPDNYYLVTNPAKLYEQLDKAFNDVISRSSSSTLLALNTTRLNSETRVYQASFNAENWSGELRAFKIAANGTLGDQVWEASGKIPEYANRKIYSWKMEKGATDTVYAATGISFSYDGLSNNQLTRLGQAAHLGTTVTAANQRGLIAYLSGDRTGEPAYRARTSLMGDIVNSDPTYGGGVDFGYDRLPSSAGGGTTYLTYLANKRAGTQMVYVGANDGMLHALNAETGVEKFAFVPDGVIGNLRNLASTDYATSHLYYVDGPLHYADAYVNSAWKSYLIGSTGAGGKSIFALDVTNPDSFSATSIKWEFTNSELGYTLNRPVIAKMANGRWAVITGNGPDSSSGTAKLFIVYLDAALNDANGWDSGQDYCTISTDTTTANGLGSVTVVLSASGTAQYIYAGDLKGRMWRFNMAAATGNCPTGWTANKIFTATNAANTAQPIMSAPQVEVGAQNGLMVFFGTGKHYETTDPTDKSIQSLYGILDKLAASPTALTRSNLTQQTFTVQKTETYTSDDGKSTYTKEIREVSRNTVDYSSKSGWYLDLVNMTSGSAVAEGERVISTPSVSGSNAIFTTYVPSADECAAGGSSWLIAVGYLTGQGQDTPFFDMNASGTFNSADGSPDGVRFGFGGAPAIASQSGGGKVILKPSDGDVEPIAIKSRRLMSSWRQIK